MGLYDSFILKEPIECPLCSNKKGNGLDHFQTKNLGSNFFCYKQGKKAKHHPFILMDGTYDVYSSCNFCHAWIDACVVIKDNIFKGIFAIKAITQEEKWKQCE